MSSQKSSKVDDSWFVTTGAELRTYGDVGTPWRKGKWLIWPETILKNPNLSDCNDTVEGICYRTKRTLDECLDMCVADECAAGMFLQFKNGKSMCIPLRTGLHPKLSPVLRLRKQQLYNLDPDVVDVSVFVNSDIFPFPPNMVNTVFFGDALRLETPDGKRVLDTDIERVSKGYSEPCVLRKRKEGDAELSRIVLQPSNRTANAFIHNRPLVYGDSFVISIPNTSLVMQVDSGPRGSLVWKEALGVFGGSSIRFEVSPTDPRKTAGDYVTYSDTVSLAFGGFGFVAVDDDSDKLYTTTSHKLMNHPAFVKYLEAGGVKKDVTFNVFFKFHSLMNAFYCEEGECKTVPVRDIEPVPYPGNFWGQLNPKSHILSAGVYKGKAVFGRPGCYGVCGDVKPGKGNKNDIITLTGDQHLGPPSTQTIPPEWDRRSYTGLWVVISITVAILIAILIWFLIKRKTG